MHISTPMSNFPRDLLQRFMSVGHLPLKLEEPSNDDSEELELTLGLSLNGRFGVDPRSKKIKRTSSIPEFTNDMAYATPMACTPLIRACSLPTETEEEWRKRKELQTLRRMEVRRKRSEKQRNSKPVVREWNREIGEEDKGPEGVKGNSQIEQGAGTSDELTSSRTTSLTRGFPPTPSSQRSNGSPGTGPSGISESECQPAEGNGGSPSVGEEKAASMKKLGNIVGGITMKNEPKEVVSSRNVLEDMPCVCTKGDGPDGKRIEGLLYGYRKGEEVRIVCVCHGSFLTPAEFVKHAGGGDVAHPLKHIIVNPTFS